MLVHLSIYLSVHAFLPAGLPPDIPEVSESTGQLEVVLDVTLFPLDLPPAHHWLLPCTLFSCVCVCVCVCACVRVRVCANGTALLIGKCNRYGKLTFTMMFHGLLSPIQIDTDCIH